MADLFYTIATVFVCLSLLPALVRLVFGPTAADRVVALDVMTVVSVALMCLIALFSARIIYIDAAFVYGLISFIGVITVARYLERGL